MLTADTTTAALRFKTRENAGQFNQQDEDDGGSHDLMHSSHHQHQSSKEVLRTTSATTKTTTRATSTSRVVKFRNYTPSDPILIEKYATRELLDSTNPEQADYLDNDDDYPHHQQTSRGKRLKPNPEKRQSVATTDTSNNNPPKSALDIALEKAKRQLHQQQHQQQHQWEGLGPGSTPLAAPVVKMNADLKRAIQPKLDKLQKQTQRAIVILLRQRLEQEAISSTSAATTTKNSEATSPSALD